MIHRFILALLVTALLAGCTNSSGTPPPTSKSDAMPANVHYSHNYTASPETLTFTIPSESTTYNVNAKIGGEGPTVCNTSQGARLVIESPTGQSYIDLSPGGSLVVSNGSGDSGCAHKENRAVHLPAGNWTVKFTGSGTFIGTVDIAPAS